MVPDKTGRVNNVLVDFNKPQELAAKMKFSLPNQGQGKEGLLEVIQQVLQYSVNTWDQGFLDKLYASTNAVSFTAVLFWCLYSLIYTGRRCIRYGSFRAKHQCKPPSHYPCTPLTLLSCTCSKFRLL